LEYTRIFYDNLQTTYDYFNEKLFENELPQAMITLQRKTGVYGYHKKNAFTNSKNENINEIALNPDFFFNRSINEILSTLVHEQVHLLCDYRNYVSRKGHHSKQWCQLMKDIGLQAVSCKNGEDCNDGGAKMTHRILDGDLFDIACKKLLETITFDLTNIMEIKEKKEKKTTKFIYVCPECNEEVTCKRNDKKIICGDCSVEMQVAEE
jgi:predicted SprT family Zn-dependent metalloprotease